MSIISTMQRHGYTLAIFAVFATGLTAVINFMTAPIIAEQAAMQQKALLDQVLPPNLYDNQPILECYLLTAANGSAEGKIYLARKNDVPVAAAIESSAPDGYSGAIRLMVGADFEGKVYGVRVLEHHETPGLGDKIELRVSDWITAFNNQIVESSQDTRWAVKKDGGMFDQFTGATITPRAIVREVKRVTLYLKSGHNNITQFSACGKNDE